MSNPAFARSVWRYGGLLTSQGQELSAHFQSLMERHWYPPPPDPVARQVREENLRRQARFYAPR